MTYIKHHYLLFLVLFLAVSLVLTFMVKNIVKEPISTTKNLGQTTSPISSGNQTTPKSDNFTTLTFNPGVTSIKLGLTKNINLLIDTGANTVSAVEFTLKFDPKILEIQSASPAGFFQNPTVFNSKLDKQQGFLNYAIGSFTPKSGNGNLMTIVINAKSLGQTQITFSGETKVAGKGEGTKNLLKNTGVANVEIVK